MNKLMTTSSVNQDLIFRAMEQSLPMILFTPDGYITWCNQKFSEFMGYSSQELIGMHHQTFCSKEYRTSKEYKQFWDDLRSGKSFHDKAERVNKTGNKVWLQAFYTPVLDKDNKVEGVAKVAMDITKQQNILNNSSKDFSSVVEEMTVSTNNVHDFSCNIINDMNTLNSESQIIKKAITEIQTIVGFINNLSTQSNILGLNASIEAARAGDSGKGFSVVAKEVSKLASTSKNSASQISDQLNDMVSSVRLVMDRLENISNKMLQNADAIEELKLAYEQINKTAEELSELI